MSWSNGVRSLRLKVPNFPSQNGHGFGHGSSPDYSDTAITLDNMRIIRIDRIDAGNVIVSSPQSLSVIVAMVETTDLGVTGSISRSSW